MFATSCVAVGFLAAAACTSVTEISKPPGSEEQDSGENVMPADGEDAGALDGSSADASVSDVVEDRRIVWDSGQDAGAPIVLDVWTRAYVSCARVQRSTSTTLECWGNNLSGELGRGETSPYGTAYRPQPVLSPDAATFKMVVSGGTVQRGATCAVTDANELKCWGAGFVTTAPITTTVPETPLLTDVASVDMSQSTACALKTDGRVACWGGNAQGQLGLGVADAVVRAVPQEIPNFTADQISCGLQLTCATKGGEVWCWGSRNILGNGMGAGTIPTPTRVGTLTDVTKVQAGAYTFALASDKTVWYWGNLGTKLSYTPTKLLDPTPDDPTHVLSAVEDIAGGCVRLTNGKVRCLAITPGAGYQLNEVPRVVDTVTHTPSCALSAAGTLRCWGDNSMGQLGMPSSQLASTTNSVTMTF